MLVIVDYGVGNLFSLISSLKSIGENPIVTGDKAIISNADKIILPGVGAFEDAIKKLKETGLDKIIIQKAKDGTPIMGICLGMQLLFQRSFEYGIHKGLGLIKGDIVPFRDNIPKELKIPHIGWNALYNLKENCPIFKYVKENEYVYFVHSYYAKLDTVARCATCEYGEEYTAAVWQDNIFACQFHPEKSGNTGLNILRGFCEIGEE